MVKNFKVLEKYKEIGEGSLICMYDKVVDLDNKTKIIPYTYL